MAQITLNGSPIHTNGELPAVGAKAPDFKLTGGDLKDVSLADYKGKRKILNIVPSLDTPVCATSTRRFNEAAGKLANTVVLVVSADLPFASERFCTTPISPPGSCRSPGGSTSASPSCPPGPGPPAPGRRSGPGATWPSD